MPTTISSVSAISGEWLESETDFILKGAEPLVLIRSFTPNNELCKLGYNWEFNRPHPLVLDKTNKKISARHQHPSGVKTIHEQFVDDDAKIIELPLSKTTGLTNCRSHEISGKTNLHNILLKYDQKRDFCEAITGNGHLIHYKFKRRYGIPFVIQNFAF